MRPPNLSDSRATARRSRRDFFKIAGVGGLLVSPAVLAACDSDGDDTPPPDADIVLDFADDFGVLNYALALEQLEAAFYTQAVASLYAGASSEERTVLTALRDHEVAHRDFLAAAIGANGGTAIPPLDVDFSAVHFSNRASVLGTAQVFEDLGVAAYNGAARLFSDTELGRTLLTLAGKIVSVEARHAAAIRDLLVPNSLFSIGAEADTMTRVVAEDTGLDRAFEVPDVLAAAGPFIATPIGFTNLA